jgi:hypothetical protein
MQESGRDFAGRTVTEYERWPAFHSRGETLQEDLMQKHDGLAVQKDRVHLVMRTRRLLWTGGHLEWAQEARDEQMQLFDVLLLRLHHPKHETDGEKRTIGEIS